VLRKLLIFVVATGLVELALLVKLGMLIGFWPMVGVVLAVSFLGLLLARSQGVRVLRAMQRDLAEGRLPAPRLLDQALVFAGGVLLVLPGLVSDVAGLALLLPPTRSLVKRALRRRLERRVERRRAEVNWVEPVSYTIVIP
jgi:UPF0716 protein FxsA